MINGAPDQRPLTRWLENSSPAVFSIYAMLAAFSTYFCMYAFRKPFSAGTYEGLTLFNTEIDLKTAFVIAVKVYLPFLVIDIVIANVLLSMGMMVLPPVLMATFVGPMSFLFAAGHSIVRGTIRPILNYRILQYTYADKRATVLSLNTMGGRLFFAMTGPFSYGAKEPDRKFVIAAPLQLWNKKVWQQK